MKALKVPDISSAIDKHGSVDLETASISILSRGSQATGLVERYRKFWPIMLGVMPLAFRSNGESCAKKAGVTVSRANHVRSNAVSVKE